MYTTLDAVKAELKATNATAGDDALLLQYIRRVTNRIRQFGFEFEPWYKTLRFTGTSMNTSTRAGTFVLPGRDTLLLPVQITVNGSALTYGTSTSDILPYPDSAYAPIRVLRFREACAGCRTWLPAGACANSADNIVIEGWWGMREYYSAQGWLNSGSTLSAGLTSSATSFTTQSVAAENPLGYTPRFSPGNLIRIDDEMLEVRAVVTATNTLTVARGVNGSTAAAHNSGAAISWWNVEADVLGEATRQACLLYARRGAFEQVVANDVATVTYPSDLLSSLRATMERFNFV